MQLRRFSGFLSPFIMLALSFVFGCSSAQDSSKFAAAASQGGTEEVALGRLAMQRAADTAVKDFGQRMVSDHSAANATLVQVAAQDQIQLPTDLTADQKSTIAKLSKLSGPDFDKQYMSDMVKDHQEDVSEFETQAKHGSDPKVKQFAAQTLPTLQSHLQMARDVAKKVGAS